MIIYNGDYYVYLHINKINGKIYVGITRKTNVNDRWHNGRGYQYNQHFWSAIKKYGWNNFEHEIFASNLTEEEASNMEKLLIEKLDTTNPNNGYNIASGGYNNRGLKGVHNPFYGVKPVKAIEASVSVRTGKHLTEEHKKKISNAVTGYVKSEEHRRKLGESQRGQVRGRGKDCANSIPVLCVETGVVFNSQREAAKQYGVCDKAISRAVKLGTRCCHLHWKRC